MAHVLAWEVQRQAPGDSTHAQAGPACRQSRPVGGCAQVGVPSQAVAFFSAAGLGSGLVGCAQLGQGGGWSPGLWLLTRMSEEFRAGTGRALSGPPMAMAEVPASASVSQIPSAEAPRARTDWDLQGQWLSWAPGTVPS